MGFDFHYMLSLFPILLEYLPTTLSMAVIGMIFSLLIGVAIALTRLKEFKFINYFIQIYLSFFRGTPLLVQLFLFYYGLPQIFPTLIGINGYTASIIGLTLHFSAYIAEIVRAAILSVDDSQQEAALSLGMTDFQATRRIILPQATRIALPSLMNNFIDMLKSTSLAFSLGVPEIMSKAQMEASSSFRFFEAFLAVAIIYWVVIIVFTRVQIITERRLNRAYS